MLVGCVVRYRCFQMAFERFQKFQSACLRRYKQCKTIRGKIAEGDQLVFESKSAGTWTFQVPLPPWARSGAREGLSL